MKYTTVDEDGRIIGRASLPADHIELNSISGRRFVKEDAPTPQHRWDGAAWAAPSREHQHAAVMALKHDEIRKSRELSESGGFYWNGHKFPSDERSRQKITLAAVTGSASTWVIDGSSIELNAAQSLQLATTLHRWQELHESLHAHYRKVVSAESTENVMQLGWPPADELHDSMTKIPESQP